jgi:putative transposase
MARPRKYSAEARERAVRMVREHGPEHPSQWAAITSIASKLGCTAETLRNGAPSGARPRSAWWTDDGRASAAHGSGARRSRAPADERDPSQGVRVFRAGGARPRTEVMVRFIDDHRATYGVEPICSVLPVAPSTYFCHHAHQLDATQRAVRARRDGDLRVDSPGVGRTLSGVWAAEDLAPTPRGGGGRRPMRDRSPDAGDGIGWSGTRPGGADRSARPRI